MKSNSAEVKLGRVDFTVLFVLVLVPLFCVVVYSLPASIQIDLAAKGNAFDPARFITSIFVHGNLQHLVGNLVVFGIFGFLLFGLNKAAGSQRFFLFCLLWVIVLVPLLCGVFVWAFSDSIFRGVLSGYSFGLSIVVSGLMGLVLPSILSLFYSELQSNFNRAVLFLGLLMLTGSIISSSYLGSSFYYWIFFLVITTVGVALTFLGTLKIASKVKGKINQSFIAKLGLVSFTIFAYFVLLVGLFPVEIAMPNGGTVNIFAHYFGVSLGTLPGFYAVLSSKKPS